MLQRGDLRSRSRLGVFSREILKNDEGFFFLRVGVVALIAIISFFAEIIDFYATLATPVVNFAKLGVHAIVATPGVSFDKLEEV